MRMIHSAVKHENPPSKRPRIRSNYLHAVIYVEKDVYLLDPNTNISHEQESEYDILVEN